MRTLNRKTLVAVAVFLMAKPGESQNVRFELKDRDLSMVTEAGEPIIAEGKYSLSISGGQLATGAPAVSGMFQVKGTKTLPE
jgi:beta-glucosidase